MRRTALAASLAALLLPSAAARAGDLVGEISWTGAAPAPVQLPVNKDPQVCGARIASEALEVKGTHLLNVVVTVKGTGVAAPAPQAATVVLDQQSCRYVPHVQAIPAGSTLQILNSDPMLHNIHGRLGTRTVFNLAMPIKGMKVPRVLAQPGLVHLKCDVHDFMEGWVVVVDGPAAVVGADGHYAIRGLPPGRYEVTAWHEKLGEQHAQVEVGGSGETRSDFTFSARPGG